jgi:lambda family phage portal protein
MQERKPPEIKRTLADRIGNALDRLVYAVAPVAGAKRMEFRRRFDEGQVRMAAHDGAKYDETRGSSWIGSRLSPDAALEEDREELLSRSQELYRNDSVGGSIDTRVNLVVSYGFTPQAAIQPREGITQAQADTWNDQLELVYDQLYPRIAISGKESLWESLRLVERLNAYAGESITILSDVGHPDKPVPLAVEVIDPFRLETPPDKIANPRIRMGIEYDAKGRITHYHIRRTHPGDTRNVNYEYDRISAARVLHVFERWFAGQSRGYPWLTRTLNRIKDKKDYGEATIIAAQVEACHAAFVETIDPLGAAGSNAAGTTTTGQTYQEVRPGGVHYLRPGEKVSFGDPSRPGNTFSPFMEWISRDMAAGMNFPYEMLAKNWGGLSFAAGRLSLADCRLFVKSQQKLLTESWLGPVWHRMVEEAVIVGAVNIPPRLYQRMPWVFHAHEWGPPAWPYALTPREEIESKIAAIDANLMTKQKVISEDGAWWREVFAQRAVEMEEERKLKILPGTAEAEVQAEAAATIEAQNADQEMAQEAAV